MLWYIGKHTGANRPGKHQTGVGLVFLRKIFFTFFLFVLYKGLYKQKYDSGYSGLITYFLRIFKHDKYMK